MAAQPPQDQAAVTSPASTDIGSLRLHARFDEGSGPVMVLLHGINRDGSDWRPVIDRIGPGYRFIAFDLLGFGASPKPLDIAYSADEHALVIENTLRDLGVDEPFLLAGYSLGGDIAIRYAATYPDRVRRLFLLSAPFYLPPNAAPTRATGLAFLEDVVSKWLWGLLATSKQRNSLIYRLVTGVIQDPLKDMFLTEDLPTHWEAMSRNLENTVNKATFVDDLPRLTMPTVFVVGVRDAIVPVHQTPALGRLKPDMEIRRIAGVSADHMMLWNMPLRVADEIMRDEVRELAVAWRGGDGAPLLILPGFEVGASGWSSVAQALAGSHDVAVVDLLGSGDSAKPLSAHYTLADHVAPVLGTIEALWGHDTPVRLVGDGIGALVALGSAATAPERVADVTAFSPSLVPPGEDLPQVAGTDERAVLVLETRERLNLLAANERAHTPAAEKAEERVVPIVRTVDNAVLGTDGRALLESVDVPVRFVVPLQDAATPRELLSTTSGEPVAAREVVTPPGGRDLPAKDPATAVAAIVPGDDAAAEVARAAGPVQVTAVRTELDRVAGGAESALLRSGLINLALAVAATALHPVPDRVLALGFVAWVLFASVSSIVGAWGLRKNQEGATFPWVQVGLPYLLLGVAGVAAVYFLVADPSDAVKLLVDVAAVYVMVRGAADLYLATHSSATSKPLWLLWLGGIVGVATALSLLSGPDHGRRIVRLALIVYLYSTGAALTVYALSTKSRAKARVAELLRRS